ncbi:LysM peptidoglycan-binding domain-containing protein [Amnibacterium kyonggiense]
MLTVQNDWIEYEEAEAAVVGLQAAPARRVAVRGGAACAQRLPVASASRGVAAVRPLVVRPAAVPAAGAGRSRPAPTSAPRRRLRLTRRGRVVLTVLPALLVLSGALLATSPGAAEASPRAASRSVVVGTGDTLWTIAERIAPTTDPRLTVAAIERVNGLRDARLDAGTVLVLPAGR